MKLQFLGANRQVTGSRHCVEAGGTRILVDCGMFQERPYLDRNWEPCPVPAGKIDAVILTHAHLDHCGLLPKLVREGFRGRVFTTAASADLVDLILRDSAQIQAEDAAFKQKRHRKEGREPKHPVVPLYTIEDVQRAVRHLDTVRYGEPTGITDTVSATFHDAGHILGSSIVELAVTENGKTERLVFSGDLGQWNKPIIQDPTLLESADYLVMESTYGNRDHPVNHGIESELAEVINATASAGGNVVVPTFAVERAQELMFYISRLVSERRIPAIPIFLDSPMAVDVTAVFERHRECFDEETWALISSGKSPLRFPGLKLVSTTEESRKINDLRFPAIIMATSGMCTAGRIKHHLAHNIQRPESTLLFVGFQVPGTLGRQILDGDPQVRIHGRMWKVRAKVAQIHGFSGHADRSGLLRWLGGFRTPPRRLLLTHGEEQVSLDLAARVRQSLGSEVSVPEYLEQVALA
ncbi:MAG: MBL fold metallo-hydrolase [Pirellulales bacterium]|nr:MBL fold metallo-hydrolase [Pirellulales bacterium]